MKKTFLLAIGFCLFTSVAFCAQNNNVTLSNQNEEYTINDAAVENIFAASTLVSFEALTAETNVASLNNLNANNSMIVNGGGKSAIVAILLDFFLGGLGVHRAYLGTKTFTWVGYILSCGGIFGLVPFVDLIVLAVNFNDIGKFEDNSKFFMW